MDGASVGPAVDADFEHIVHWTSERFSDTQATVYAENLSMALAALTEGPEIIGVKARDEILHGLFSLHVARQGRRGWHFIMLRLTPRGSAEFIEVLRLLHDSMDLPRHFDASKSDARQAEYLIFSNTGKVPTSDNRRGFKTLALIATQPRGQGLGIAAPMSARRDLKGCKEMKSLPEHASMLGDALFAIYQSDQLHEIYSYLNIASGLVSARFKLPGTSGPALCEPVGLDALPEELTDTLTACWSRFSAAWFALEAFDAYWTRGIILDPMELESPPPQRLRQLPQPPALPEPPTDAGPIERLCYKLSKRYCHPLPQGYEQCLKTFRDLAEAPSVIPPAYVRPSAEGLYLVNQVRHALAQWNHLDLELQEDPALQEHPAIHPHVEMIDTATRLVLLTLQMMALCIFPLGTQLETYGFMPSLDDEELVDLDDAMLNLHLVDYVDRLENILAQRS